MQTHLNPNQLLQQAEQTTGLHDWGDTDFKEGLQRLCDAANVSPDFSDAALENFIGLITATLIKRLHFYHDRKCHPEIAQQKIIAPLVVTGLPRSGTTILHALLAQDPAARSPLTWEVAQPSPPPHNDSFTTDPRIAATQAFIDSLDPTFKAMHAVGANLPEECNAFMTMAFLSPNFSATNPVRTYAQWLFKQTDASPAYALHKQVLQHLQAFAPSERWVLKAPPHIFWLDKLLATYPDARVVFTHRDPAEVLPSNASLISHLLAASGSVDKKQVGTEQNTDWRTGLTRAMEFRQQHANKNQFIDVHYQQSVSDPMSVVETIYSHFDITLTDQARQNMLTFLANNKQGKHGKHRYSAEEFGMTKAGIHKEFADYIQAYNISTQ